MAKAVSKSRKSYLYIIVALVTLILVAVVSFSLGRNTTLQESTNAGEAVRVQQLRATSCDGDDNCEINTASIQQAKVQQDLIVNGGLSVSRQSTFSDSTSYFGLANFRGGLQATQVKIGVPQNPDPALDQQPTLVVDQDAARFTEPVSFSEDVDVFGRSKLWSLNGQGNAYACLDASGILYRSINPCR